jgi:hypothetical protein
MLVMAASAQQSLTIPDREILPPASLWENYSYALQASGGIAPYRWSLVTGSLPHGFELSQFGELTGVPQATESFKFTARVRDNSNPPIERTKEFTVLIETPLLGEWDHKASVNGQRIDGAIKVSNRTGRDFDLTVIVLAVNDIGRATAIGYQHFSLKRGTSNLDIPFGDTVSRGTYAVNVDVVAEEPISNRIFRARLVSERQQVTPGP